MAGVVVDGAAVEGGGSVSRLQRRVHLLVWCLLGPGVLAVLWLALRAQPSGDEVFEIVPRVEAPADAAVPE